MKMGQEALHSPWSVREALELIERLAILLQVPSANPAILSSGSKGIDVYIQVEK